MADVDREQLGALLSAYLDGEVTAEEAIFVERSIAEDEHARQLLAELRGTAQLVSSLPVHAAPKSIAEDLQFHAERSDLLGDADEARQIGGPLRVSSLSRLAVAAMLAVIVLGGWWFSVGPGARVSPVNGTRIVDTYELSQESPVTAFDDLSNVRRRQTPGANAPVSLVPGGKGKQGVAEPGDRGGLLETPGESGLKRKQRRGGAVARRGIRGTGFVSRDVITQGKKAVIVTADLEQKLARLPLVSLLRHRFESERVRLRISVKNLAQADAVTARLTSHLERDQVINLTDRPTIIAGGSDSGRNFYYRGQAGSNFDEVDQHQLLIRIPASKINGLMEELGHVVGVKDSVTLVIDSSPISGLDDARRALGSLRVQPVAVDVNGEIGLTDALAARPPAPREEVEVIAQAPVGQEESNGPIFVDLLKAMFGLNLEEFVPAPQPPPYGPLREASDSEILPVAPRLGEDAKQVRPTQEDSSYRGTIAGPTKKASIELAVGGPPGLVERRLRELAEKSATLLTPKEQTASPDSAERLVTLVVQVSVSKAEATKRNPVKRPEASPKSDTAAEPQKPAKK